MLGTLCRPPPSREEWPLRLESASLGEWIEHIERATHSLMRAILAPPEVRDGLPQLAHPSLPKLPRMLAAVQSVVGPSHWVTAQLIELQLDHWLQIALEASPREATARELRESAEAALCDHMRREAGVVLKGLDELASGAFYRLEAVARFLQRCHIEQAWEAPFDYLEVLNAWGVAAQGARACTLRALADCTLERVQVEYGGIESPDYARLSRIYTRSGLG